MLLRDKTDLSGVHLQRSEPASMDALFSYVEHFGDYQQRQVLLEGIASRPHVDRGVLQMGCESELATPPNTSCCSYLFMNNYYILLLLLVYYPECCPTTVLMKQHSSCGCKAVGVALESNRHSAFW